jgi:hypothetical protein
MPPSRLIDVKVCARTSPEIKLELRPNSRLIRSYRRFLELHESKQRPWLEILFRG